MYNEQPALTHWDVAELHMRRGETYEAYSALHRALLIEATPQREALVAQLDQQMKVRHVALRNVRRNA